MIRNEVKLKDDRRIFERFSVPLFLRLIDLDTGRELEANTCDLSATGLGIVGKGCLKSGDRLELWLSMKNAEAPFYTRGVVVWTRPQDGDGHRTGISLEKAELKKLFFTTESQRHKEF